MESVAFPEEKKIDMAEAKDVTEIKRIISLAKLFFQKVEEPSSRTSGNNTLFSYADLRLNMSIL